MDGPAAGLRTAAFIVFLLPAAPLLRAASAAPSSDGSLRAARLYSTVDTILVFDDNLETLTSPGSEGGWTHVDESAQPTAWGISSLYGCGSNAFWCGVVDSSWNGDLNRRGYANNWDQFLENFADLVGAPSPYTLSFTHRMNVESGFDFGYAEVFDLDDGWVPLASFTGVVNDGVPACGITTATIPDSTVTKLSPTRFRFHFKSDGQGSSADGLYPAGEGWAIDNVTVKGGVFDVRFFDDMEAGLGTWTRSILPSVGDYWKVVSDPATEQLCTTNMTKVWRVTSAVTGALVPRLNNNLISPAVAVNRSDQVFLFFDVYRNLPFDACFYYAVRFRTRNAGSPGWSVWIDPTGLLYSGIEREWFRQTVALAGAAGVDSIQIRIGVQDYGPIFCGGSQTSTGTSVLFDNFKVGVIGAAGPAITVSEADLFNDTFSATPFFGNDNWNTLRGDSIAAMVGAARGLKSAFLQYSISGAPFTPVSLTKVGTNAPGAYYADVAPGASPRGAELRYYFVATDSTDIVATLPADALAANHYFRATILPGIQAASGSCPNDTARILYVNGISGPDAVTGISQSLGAIGARYDRFDINAPQYSEGNSPGGGDPADLTRAWPAVSLATLGIYQTIVWDVGDRAAQTLSALDQPLLESWLALPGRNRGLLLAGDNLAYDLIVNGQGVPNFLTCQLGASYVRDIWENSPQDSLTPTLVGAPGTRIHVEPFPLDGGCPGINSFDGLAVSSCVGANGRAWLRYPNTLVAATERVGALGPPGGDSLRSIVMGFSLNYMPNPVRRNLFLYRTLVEEFETPTCYVATGVPMSPPGAVSLAVRLYPAAPNPFNPRTALRFQLDQGAWIRLRVFRVDGALVKTLSDRAYPAGEHRLFWDGRDDRGWEVGSGAYFLSLEANGRRAAAAKLILLR